MGKSVNLNTYFSRGLRLFSTWDRVMLCYGTLRLDIMRLVASVYLALLKNRICLKFDENTEYYILERILKL